MIEFLEDLHSYVYQGKSVSVMYLKQYQVVQVRKY